MKQVSLREKDIVTCLWVFARAFCSYTYDEVKSQERGSGRAKSRVNCGKKTWSTWHFLQILLFYTFILCETCLSISLPYHDGAPWRTKRV